MTSEWISFYTMLTPIAGAFLALLFVALQVGASRWDKLLLRHLAAVRNLIELATPLAVGFFALYPGGRWWLGGIIAAILGLVFGIIYIVVFFVERCRGVPMTWYEPFQAYGGVVLPNLYYGLLLYGSVRNDDLGIHIVGWLCIWALMSGLSQSWLLLMAKTKTP